jgi:hypothetical protein
MLGVRLVQKKELVLAIRECNRVACSDGMNLSDVLSVSAVFGHSLVQTIYLSDFHVKHKFSCFRRKFGDQSMLRVVGFRLGEGIMLGISRA